MTSLVELLGPDLSALNKNTVLRVVHVLRDEGLLEFRRGRGITVAGTSQHGQRSPARSISSNLPATTASAATKSSTSSKAFPDIPTAEALEA